MEDDKLSTTAQYVDQEANKPKISQNKRRSYTSTEKSNILDYYDYCNSIHMTANDTGVSRKSISLWISQRYELEKDKNSKLKRMRAKPVALKFDSPETKVNIIYIYIYIGIKAQKLGNKCMY